MSCNILAIESSCDETSASVISDGKILNNIVATQSVHEKYGGVVPELASRAHQQHLIPVVSEALLSAGIGNHELSAVAFTRGPGLMGALLVGVSFAKSFAYALDLPLIEINHMEAHVLAHFISSPSPRFPFLCLTVSGGHTQIVLVSNHLDMEVVGETTDDAAGEAFDKIAKILGLPYPGGPFLDKLAATGDARAFEFPVSSIRGLDFSFSGIKTAVLYFLKDRIKEDPGFIGKHLGDICASVQFTLVKMLMEKLKKASDRYGIKEIAIAGGVSANNGLRTTLDNMSRELGWDVYIPKLEYCTDNAAMIAMAAHYKFQAGIFSNLEISPLAKMKIGING
ncbi:MAG: tRNA (adenosine(37)-N6)-threonylcarbamoyltransferase complex transferase subunit TsaD [Cyclobacteriaceae bacterium]